MSQRMTGRKWIEFSPAFSGQNDKEQFLSRIEILVKSINDDVFNRLQTVEHLREELAGRVAQTTVSAAVRSACLVFADLIAHGWECCIQEETIKIARPLESADLQKERERVQHQLHVERNRQLRSGAVVEFVKDMERRRVHRGRWMSIFSLMRDGCELAANLRSFRKSIL